MSGGNIPIAEAIGAKFPARIFLELCAVAFINKLVVVNRYQDVPPAVAFIKNFGLKQGAIASSVGHDSHNITAVGCDDASICQAVNLIIEANGGLAAVGIEQGAGRRV